MSRAAERPASKTPKEETEYYVEETSMPFMKRIYFYKSRPWKLFWAGAFVLGMALSINSLWGIFLLYFSYPSTITLTVLNNETFEFPAVSVCNVNPIKMLKVDDCEAFGQIKRMQSQLVMKSIEEDPAIKTLYEQTKTGSESLIDWLKSRDPLFRDIATAQFDMSQCPVDRKKRQTPSGATGKVVTLDGSPSYVFENITTADHENYAKIISQSRMSDFTDVTDLVVFKKELIDRLGYSADELLIECSYDRSECHPNADFVKFMSAKNGNCYSFNTGKDGTPTRWTRKSGKSYGLRLTVNIDRDNYIGLLAAEYGAVVMIHHPHVVPKPEDKAIIVKPGQLTAIGVKRKDVQRLIAPYSNRCVNEMPDQYKPFVEDSSSYNLRQCLAACRDYYLNKQCKCVDQLRLPSILTQAFNESLCDLFDQTERECRAKTVAQIAADKTDKDKLDCDCNLPCQETVFTTTISQADWPSDEYRQLRMFNYYKEESLATALFNDSLQGQVAGRARIEHNLLRLHVFLESLSFEQLVEEPAMTTDSLIGNVGGLLGIYLGMTMIGILEVIEYLVLLAITLIKGRSSSPAPKSTSSKPAKDKKRQNSVRQRKPDTGRCLPPPMIA